MSFTFQVILSSCRGKERRKWSDDRMNIISSLKWVTFDCFCNVNLIGHTDHLLVTVQFFWVWATLLVWLKSTSKIPTRRYTIHYKESESNNCSCWLKWKNGPAGWVFRKKRLLSSWKWQRCKSHFVWVSETKGKPRSPEESRKCRCRRDGALCFVVNADN